MGTVAATATGGAPVLSAAVGPSPEAGLIRPRISALMADMPFLTAEGHYRFIHKQREWDALRQSLEEGR